MKEINNVMIMYYSTLYTLSNSNYGRIYQDKPFIDDIPEEDCIQRIDLLIFRGNSLIGNNTRRRCFQRIREYIHSPFLIKGNYYNEEREVE